MVFCRQPINLDHYCPFEVSQLLRHEVLCQEYAVKWAIRGNALFFTVGEFSDMP